ncbi:MAG: hypothetical protein Ct9H300mP1_04370 [Planctomycetaceae bacterium]|nr:MAG: hypothetical protein Ct9H300mP1_04370 [Planctomycetaceae bacterium]
MADARFDALVRLSPGKEVPARIELFDTRASTRDSRMSTPTPGVIREAQAWSGLSVL